MKAIPLGAVPSQTLSVVLAKQAARITLTTKRGNLYFSLTNSGAPVVTNRICRNEQRLLLDAQYQGFVGDFAFVDTQGDTDPVYLGLGAAPAARYYLLYFEASDLGQ